MMSASPKPGEAEPDAALRLRLGVLLRQRPDGDVQHVVEHAHRRVDHFAQGVEVELPRAR